MHCLVYSLVSLFRAQPFVGSVEAYNFPIANLRLSYVSVKHELTSSEQVPQSKCAD